MDFRNSPLNQSPSMAAATESPSVAVGCSIGENRSSIQAPSIVTNSISNNNSNNKLDNNNGSSPIITNGGDLKFSSSPPPSYNNGKVGSPSNCQQIAKKSNIPELKIDSHQDCRNKNSSMTTDSVVRIPDLLKTPTSILTSPTNTPHKSVSYHLCPICCCNSFLLSLVDSH